jgi:hypothetical protein
MYPLAPNLTSGRKELLVLLFCDKHFLEQQVPLYMIKSHVLCLQFLVSFKAQSKEYFSILGAHIDAREVFADREKLIVDAALLEQRSGGAVEEHCRS